jgi:hypothetical protein
LYYGGNWNIFVARKSGFSNIILTIDNCAVFGNNCAADKNIHAAIKCGMGIRAVLKVISALIWGVQNAVNCPKGFFLLTFYLLSS